MTCSLTLGAVHGGVEVSLGLAAHLVVVVGFDPAKSQERPGGASRTGFGCAAFRAALFGARLVFIYGTYHWFSSFLGQIRATRQLNAAGLSNGADLHGPRRGAGPQRAAGRLRAGSHPPPRRRDGAGRGREQHPVTGVT